MDFTLFEFWDASSSKIVEYLSGQLFQNWRIHFFTHLVSIIRVLQGHHHHQLSVRPGEAVARACLSVWYSVKCTFLGVIWRLLFQTQTGQAGIAPKEGEVWVSINVVAAGLPLQRAIVLLESVCLCLPNLMGCWFSCVSFPLQAKESVNVELLLLVLIALVTVHLLHSLYSLLSQFAFPIARTSLVGIQTKPSLSESRRSSSKWDRANG